MTRFELFVALLPLTIACLIVIANYGFVFKSRRNAKLGIKEHYSPVPVVSLICAIFAYRLYPDQPKYWIWIIPMLDIANLQLLYFSAILVRGRLRGKESTPPDLQ